MEGNSMKKEQKEKQSRKLSGVFYLGRYQGIYYVPERNQVFQFVFPTDIVSDLEVVRPDLLASSLKDFLLKNQIEPRSFSLLLADEVVFAKTVTQPDIKIREEEITAFIDTVPFEEPSVVRIATETHILVAVVNREYIMAFKSAFASSGHILEIAIPAFLLSKFVDFKKSQDASSFSIALKHSDEFKSYNLNQEDLVINPSEKPLISKEVPKDKKRLFILGGVFAVLIIVLGIVIYMSMQPIATAPLTQKPAPVVAQVEVIQPVQLTGVVLFASSTASKAAILESRLKAAGVSTVELSQTQSITATNSSILFAPTVTQEQRLKILTEINSIGETIEAYEDNEITEDIVITIVR